MFGVWRAPSLLNVTGRGLLAAGTCTYGPRTTLTVGLGLTEGVAEFLLVGECSPSGRWVLANTYSAIGEGRLFAPGNLRAVTEHPGYAQLIHYWQQNRYQLRYTGGMVSQAHGVSVLFISQQPGTHKDTLWRGHSCWVEGRGVFAGDRRHAWPAPPVS